MYENFRLIFSIIWLFATGCLLGSILAFIISWGGYTDYLLASAIVWVIATIGGIVTSL